MSEENMAESSGKTLEHFSTESHSVSFGFTSSGSGGIEPAEYRLALQRHIANMQMKLNEIDVPSLTDGDGI